MASVQSESQQKCTATSIDVGDCRAISVEDSDVDVTRSRSTRESVNSVPVPVPARSQADSEEGPSPGIGLAASTADLTEPFANPRNDHEEETDEDHAGPGMGPALSRLLQCLIENWKVVEEDPIPLRGDMGALRRVFVLIRQKTSRQQPQPAARATVPGDRFDYEHKYATDTYDEGMSPNARIWRVFLDEAGPFDLDMVEDIRDTVDVILVFAGLFSAIVSTLVAQASTALQPDYGRITSSLLTELIEVQRALAAGTHPNDVSRSPLNLSSPSTTATPDRWVNGMWFISLTFSLSTALLAVLVKQWIQAYVSPISGTTQHQGRVRQFRYMGIQKWQVPLIVGLLPILLHLALFLFFIGLVVLLSTLDTFVAVFVGCIATLAYISYTVTNLIPLWHPECPYKTPMSTFAFAIMHTFSPGLQKRNQQLRHFTAPIANSILSAWRGSLAPLTMECQRRLQQWNSVSARYAVPIGGAISRMLHDCKSRLFPSRRPSPTDSVGLQLEAGDGATRGYGHSKPDSPVQIMTLQKSESIAVLLNGDGLDAHMLTWLCNTSANPSVRTVVFGALVDMRVGYPEDVMGILRAGLLGHVCSALKECTAPTLGEGNRDPRKGMEAKLLAYLSVHLLLTPPNYDRGRPLDYQCGCNWRLAESSWPAFRFCNPYIGGVGLLRHPMLYGKQTRVDMDHIHHLQPPAIPKSLWIMLLCQGLYDVRHLAPSFAIMAPFQAQSWPAFTSLWALNQREYLAGGQRFIFMKDPPEDSFLFLRGILLSAYLCHWYSIIIGVTLEDYHPLNIQEQDPVPKLLSLSRDGKGHYQHVRMYYDFRTTANVLCHLIATSPPDRDPLKHVLEKLHPLRKYLFQFSQLDPRYTNLLEIHTLPRDHPLLDQIPLLLPTPASIWIARSQAQGSGDLSDLPMDRMDVLLCLCKFLFQLNMDRTVPIVKENNMLQAFENVREHLLANPRAEDRRDTVRMVNDIMFMYLTWACSQSDPTAHLDYMFQHLPLICGCSIVAGVWGVEPILSHCVTELITQRPWASAWLEAIEELPEEVMQLPMSRFVKPFIQELHERLTSEAPLDPASKSRWDLIFHSSMRFASV